MGPFCKLLVDKYCMNENSFTETDYLSSIQTLLNQCRRVERLSLNLPYQLVGHRSNTTTMILANTIKAFATRPRDQDDPKTDSADLETLVIDNLTDLAVCDLWSNPIDVGNVIKMMARVKHLGLSFRRYLTRQTDVWGFYFGLWNMVTHAKELESLYLCGEGRSPASASGSQSSLPQPFRISTSWQMDVDEFLATGLCMPTSTSFPLKRLELKHLELDPDMLRTLCANFGDTLEELFLNDVALQLCQFGDDMLVVRAFWVGLPDEEPGDDATWFAPLLRAKLPRLRVCRASFLGYHAYSHSQNTSLASTNVDFEDPSGLGRSLAQRFVEVACGFRQPNPKGGSLAYLSGETPEPLVKDRPARISVEDYDANAYQLAVANPMSAWQRSIDGVFANGNVNSLKTLRYIAQTASDGMNASQAAAARLIRSDEGVRPGEGDMFADDVDFDAEWSLSPQELLMQEVAISMREELARWGEADNHAQQIEDDGNAAAGGDL